MEYFFPLCHKVDMVIELNAIKSVQHVPAQEDTVLHLWPQTTMSKPANFLASLAASALWNVPLSGCDLWNTEKR